MADAQARRMRLSANRSLVLDGCHIAKRIPYFPVERLCDLADIDALRKAAPDRVSWSAIFLKAYALVAQRTPVLRRCYLSFPWPHLYEQSHNVGMLAMNREHQGESRLCWGRFIRPEQKPLVDLQRALERYQTEPIEQAFKRQVILSRLPLPLRRLIWWCNLNLLPAKRPRFLGTFSMSSLAGQGAYNRGHSSVLTTTLSYGPLDEAGRSLVTLICDHRVVDGAPAAQALVDLERTLQQEIARELRELATKPLAA